VLADITTNPYPARKGKNMVQVKLSSADGRPIIGAKVNVQFFMAAMPEMGMAEMKSSSQLNEQGNGSYAGQIELGSGGTWQVTINAEQNGKLILTKRLNVSATGGM
jgi:Cu(I)/Ag(I) efflux system membrane fusion protein/cobalt-zinc-cadmium efflux system membrane fusion protein